MDLKIFGAALGTISGLAWNSVVAAQAADAVRVPGTVIDFKPSVLTVKTREGSTDAIKLNPGWNISGVAKASADDVKPATSSASRPSRRRMAAAARWKW